VDIAAQSFHVTNREEPQDGPTHRFQATEGTQGLAQAPHQTCRCRCREAHEARQEVQHVSPRMAPSRGRAVLSLTSADDQGWFISQGRSPGRLYPHFPRALSEGEQDSTSDWTQTRGSHALGRRSPVTLRSLNRSRCRVRSASCCACTTICDETAHECTDKSEQQYAKREGRGLRMVGSRLCRVTEGSRFWR
jgi:hypothetical protein